MDSLRYWVLEMHVDGFRFDLASALARELYEVNSLAAFFDIIHQDPVLSTTKLIAEPWDLGEGGYQVGNFPLLWSEWNGKYRDSMRDFWRDHDCRLGEFAFRITGSSDLYQANGKRPTPASTLLPATMALPYGTWSATTKSTTWPTTKTTATARATTALGTAALKVKPMTFDSCPTAQTAAQLFSDAVPLPGGADAAGGRRVWPHPAGQQQYLLPRQRIVLV
jgi:hypothetical protein